MLFSELTKEQREAWYDALKSHGNCGCENCMDIVWGTSDASLLRHYSHVSTAEPLNQARLRIIRMIEVAALEETRVYTKKNRKLYVSTG